VSAEPPARGGTRKALIGGVGLGVIAVALVLWLREPAFVEVEEFFPEAAPEVIAAWTEQWHRRADPWLEVPDPPGEGDVVRKRYWLSLWSYDMEVRRRGANFVVAIAGVAPHRHGGGWAAFGEGRITGEARDFRGAVATFTWSCLGVRYRHASDGVGRLVFTDDGHGVTALYVAYEAPALWAKAYGREMIPGEEAPPFRSMRGQIPFTPALQRLPADGAYRVRVRVEDDAGRAVHGALVRLKGRAATRLTDGDGRCEVSFRGKEAAFAQTISAGADGHRNAEVAFLAGDDWPGLRAGDVAEHEVTVVLPRLDLSDHPDYVWANASPTTDPEDVMACGTCHPWQHDQWIDSRHARMADNGHVTWERKRMRKADASAPDDCHGCHQPAHAADHPESPWRPRGMQAGNHCDFCHKIARVADLQKSGVLGGYALARPDPKRATRPGSIQHVFGTAPDATFAYMGAAYSALFAQGHLCGGCHQGGGRGDEGGLPKLDTHEEWSRWLETRTAPEDRKSCQDCHMAGASIFSSAGKPMDQMAWDGLHRSPEAIHSHRFFGSEPPFAMEALKVDVDKRRDLDTGEWIVKVSVTNTGAGHKVPTGTWSKRVVVGVWATVAGKPLVQRSGSRTWLQPAAPTDVAYAPGDWTNPGGFVLGVRAAADPDGRQTAPPFWQIWPRDQVVDTRLEPDETRVAVCRFEGTQGTVVPAVEVRILHRRGRLAEGAASVPWTLRPYDPPPEVLWARIRR